MSTADCVHEPLTLPAGHDAINFCTLHKLPAGAPTPKPTTPPEIQIRLCRKCHTVYWEYDEVTDPSKGTT